MDQQVVKDTINALYEGAGIGTKFNGPVNDSVAMVLGDLLKEIGGCSSALAWVPKPSGGPATIKWVARNITRSMVSKFKDKMSITCARARILQYQTPLRLAALGL